MLRLTLFFTLFISTTPLCAMLKKKPKPLYACFSDLQNPWAQKFNAALQKTPICYNTDTLTAEQGSDTSLEKNIHFCVPLPTNIYTDIIKLAHLYSFKKEALILSIGEKPSFTESTFNAWTEENGECITNKMDEQLCYIVPQKIYYAKPKYIIVCTLLVDTELDHKYHFYFSLNPKKDSVQYIASEKFDATEFFGQNVSPYTNGPQYMYQKIDIPKAKKIKHSVLSFYTCPSIQNDPLPVDDIENKDEEHSKKCLIM